MHSQIMDISPTAAWFHLLQLLQLPTRSTVSLVVGATSIIKILSMNLKLTFRFFFFSRSLGLALNFGVPLTVYATLVDGDVVYV